jgi:hypothetical protein
MYRQINSGGDRHEPIRSIRRFAAALAGLATVLVAFSAGPGFALPVPPLGGGSAGTPVAPAQVHTVVAGGMPGWQIALIAIGAALFAATVAVLLDRARGTRRHDAPSAA